MKEGDYLLLDLQSNDNHLELKIICQVDIIQHHNLYNGYALAALVHH